MSNTRLIAFYLPQYHPIPENDEWWAPGFTEWTNVAKAKPLFKGHVQPKIPRDLGFYDLRVPETRIKQAELAKMAGIEGFCYWHYWFGNGKRLLERPFDEVVASGSPDFPFCLGWANHSWLKKTWVQENDGTMLIEQLYPGKQDYIDHFNTMLSAFKDHRYMKVDGKLIFLVWNAAGIPDVQEFFDTFNDLAKQNGLDGFYFIGFTRKIEQIDQLKALGYDSVCVDMLKECDKVVTWWNMLKWKLSNHHLYPSFPRLIRFDDYAKLCIDFFKNDLTNVIPCIMPNWDHTPRSLARGEAIVGSTPDKFTRLVSEISKIQNLKTDNTKNLVFIKSWNEWGEGNYLEPDTENGMGYINALGSLMKQKI